MRKHLQVLNWIAHYEIQWNLATITKLDSKKYSNHCDSKICCSFNQFRVEGAILLHHTFKILKKYTFCCCKDKKVLCQCASHYVNEQRSLCC